MRLRNYPKPIVDEEQRRVYTVDRAYQAAIMRHRQFIRTKSRTYARGGATGMADEFVQVARVELWNREPSRYTEADDAYVRAQLQTAMRHAARDMETQGMIPMAGRFRQQTLDWVHEQAIMDAGEARMQWAAVEWQRRVEDDERRAKLRERAKGEAT